MNIEDEEVGLPRAALNKLIKDVLPNVRVANETRDLIYNCALEFIRAVSTAANQRCTEEQKKTIAPQHVTAALFSLGFTEEMLLGVESVMEDCREQAARRLKRHNSRLDKLGIPEEELYKQQQELFDKARQDQAELATQQASYFQSLISSVHVTSSPVYERGINPLHDGLCDDYEV